VVHAEHVANEVRKHGIDAEVVTGETPKAERDETVKRFKDGKLRCLVNVAVFTTGFNAPICDLIALLMATKSTGKYVQIVGRGMRVYPEKANCLLMDYGGNVLEHGMVDDVDPVRTRNIFNVVKNPEPVKECPQCHVILHTRVMQCPACDFIFTTTAAHGTEAYDGAVLKSQQEPFVVEVVEMYCTRHKKPGKPDSVKVAFYDKDDREFALWACLDHDGFAKEKAEQVVKTLGGKATTVAEAMKEWSYWKKVTHVKVKPEGKFYRIEGFVFGEQVITRQTCLVAEGETT
jgi:DNA repair protein RadD